MQGLYNDFLKAQLQATLAAFWIEVYHAWFEKSPEISVLYPSVPNDETLMEEQNKLLGIAVSKRCQVGIVQSLGPKFINTDNSLCSKSEHGLTTDYKGVVTHQLM